MSKIQQDAEELIQKSEELEFNNFVMAATALITKHYGDISGYSYDEMQNDSPEKKAENILNKVAGFLVHHSLESKQSKDDIQAGRDLWRHSIVLGCTEAKAHLADNLIYSGEELDEGFSLLDEAITEDSQWLATAKSLFKNWISYNSKLKEESAEAVNAAQTLQDYTTAFSLIASEESELNKSEKTSQRLLELIKKHSPAKNINHKVQSSVENDGDQVGLYAHDQDLIGVHEDDHPGTLIGQDNPGAHFQ